jgi:asparagine synthase (glutamine-hydrolysing)
MCGICGVIDWSDWPDAAALVRRMNPTMVHRGPDDEGIADFGFRISDLGQLKSEEQRAESVGQGTLRGALSIGMRRLSIIDLEGGHQPIFNEDGRVGAVLNGEIYNFQELSTQLQDRGHTFRTRSDSEVVVHAYEEWGTECVERFEGMFALAVWDWRKQEAGGGRQEAEDDEQGGKLFLARDRFGIKPLYYTASSKQQTANSRQQSANSELFLFASEVRTLLASGVVPRQLSRPALESYLLFGSVSEPMTLVEGVLSLPPGHWLTVDFSAGRAAASTIKMHRYWNMAVSDRNNGSANGGSVATYSAAAAARHVRELLEDSVRKHLIADVPAGVFLSGGIDSTALAALASRESSGVHTFTVAFPEKEFSEAAIARQTAEKFGTTHQEVMLTGDEMLGRIGDAVGALDQPTMDGINTYFVSWSARQAGLKVALSGLGGDEVFGGYRTFSRTANFQRMGKVGRFVPAGVRSATATALAHAGGTFLPGDAARKMAALWSGPGSLPDPFYFGRTLFTPAQVSELMNGAPTGHTPGEDGRLWWDWLATSAEEASHLDAFASVSCMEASSYLVNTLLRDTDSMSMAHSLEVRVPFLSHPLVEFVTQLPQELKLRKGTPKALLVAALEDLLPPEVVYQTKRGFTFPWTAWLRGPLKKSIENGFADLSPVLQESLNAQTVRGIWQSYLDGKTTWSRPWSLYVLNEWVKRHIG